ncbi:MAG: domain, G-beta repeat, partial [Verrucomicrobiales bacterium]|nr:domain, G-beta repeat [Verrucomicrobiales bacterium]
MLRASLCLLLAFAAAKTSAAALEKNTREAMQLLKVECASCHSPEKKKGGLILTTRETLLKGGDDGAVVSPGKPDGSLLIKSLAKDADPHMPPKKQLTDAQVKLLRDWVKSGAEWNANAFEEDLAAHPVQLQPLPGDYRPVFALALSPDGSRLAVGRGGSVTVHKVGKTNNPVVVQFQAHSDAVQSLAWSQDAHMLASGGFRQINLWDPESGERQRTITNGLMGLVTGVAVISDGKELLVADSITAQGAFVRKYRVEDGKLLKSWRAHADTIYGFACSADQKNLATAGGDKLIKVWEIETGKELSQLEGHSAQVLAVAFNSNATQVASCGVDKDLKVWDVQSRQKIATLGKHTAEVTALYWPQGGKTIYAATDAGAIYSYTDLKAHSGMESSNSGEERKLASASDAVLCIAAISGTNLFVGTHSGKVLVYNKDGKLLETLSSETLGEQVSASPALTG